LKEIFDSCAQFGRYETTLHELELSADMSSEEAKDLIVEPRTMFDKLQLHFFEGAGHKLYIQIDRNGSPNLTVKLPHSTKRFYKWLVRGPVIYMYILVFLSPDVATIRQYGLITILLVVGFILIPTVVGRALFHYYLNKARAVFKPKTY
jgi:hypothetical protein